ncbi:hypothetical protein B0T36_24405 [Nocardia donostiensis]|uniref:hypothetical protein n=1 Tax=Nocardia donostiensis TaxID=1538463 RepID=UPI0009DB3225|nr:hypothetical protein [Nocardia donostiensis]OQS12599.1 hypothetical protein B0T36_24405 [Nocardia donostiensis]
MESNRTKVAGPLAAAGAVSLGLILIGACGIGHDDTYVAPPPIESGSRAATPPPRDGTTTTVATVAIPPSPTWRIAPVPPPRRTLPTEYTTDPPDERDNDYPDTARGTDETTTAPTHPTPSRASTSDEETAPYQQPIESEPTTGPAAAQLPIPVLHPTEILAPAPASPSEQPTAAPELTEPTPEAGNTGTGQLGTTETTEPSPTATVPLTEPPGPTQTQQPSAAASDPTATGETGFSPTDLVAPVPVPAIG